MTNPAAAADQHTVVVTGIGAISCLGSDVASTWEGMREGRSGIRDLERSRFQKFAGGDDDRWTTRFGGEIEGPDLAGVLDHREAKRLDRCTLMGVLAADAAIKDSGYDFTTGDPSTRGVIIGSGIGGIATIENSLTALTNKGPERVSPFTVPGLMANASTGQISIKYNLQGPSSCHATACASSGHAIGDAVNHIRAGLADVMLSGGAEAAITPLTVSSFASMKALSTRNDDPTKASRPFDQDRDGFVLAEGACILVLESLAHAKARGATIYAEIKGHGNAADAHHIAAPDPNGGGAARSMKAALADARLNPSEIDYINAHGTSTPKGDEAEVSAVLELFGDHARKSAGGSLLMSSTKSVHGHALGASGAIESIACINAVRGGVVAPTVNLDNPDDDFDIDLVPREARETPVRYAMNNTFGFGGHNVTLVFGTYEG